MRRGRLGVRPRSDPGYFAGCYPFVQIGDLPSDGGTIGGCRQTLNEKGVLVSKIFPKGSVLLAIVGDTIANTYPTGIFYAHAVCSDRK